MSKTILLADDSVTIQKVIELTFMDQDYELDAVSNGDDALERLGQSSPDFVIADVHMPGASGYEVARRSKELHPGVPVLLLVGTFEPFDDGEFRSSGADETLKKPFDSQELLRLVGELSPSVAEPDPIVEEPAAESVVEPVEASVAADSWATAPFNIGGDSVAEAPAEVVAAVEEAPAEVVADPVADVWAAEAPTSSEPEPFVAEETPVAAEPVDLADFAPVAVEPVAEQPVAEEPTTQEPVAEEPVAEEPPPVELAAEPVEEAVAELPVQPEPAASEVPVAAAPTSAAFSGGLSEEDVERIARRVVEKLSEKMTREIAWEVIPDLAEVVIKDRLRELESQVE